MLSPLRLVRNGLTALIVTCVVAVRLTAATPLPPLAFGSHPTPPADDPIPARIAPPAEAFTPAVDRAVASELYPFYAWPMERVLGDGLFCANYVDEDTTGGVRDFMNGAWTYDTHRGTDISLIDFKAMDRGFRIVAAAPGTVTHAVWANTRDRNCAVPDDPTLNYIEVANGDGTYTYYYHLRANSMTVQVGDAIATGEMLGMAGSSGYAFGPHLHFEAADWLSGRYQPRDPWAGPGNPNPGRWIAQAPYAGMLPLSVLDLQVTTQDAVGGDIFNVDYCGTIQERVQQPVTFGLGEPLIGMVFHMVAHAGQSYTAELRQPDGNLYANASYTFTGDMAGGYHNWYWYWSPYATQPGVWKARVLSGTTVLAEQSFTAGPATAYGPRFVRGGRSFRVDGTTQRDTLRLRPLGGTGVTLSLAAAPAFVSLHDSVVTIGPVSDQPFRSRYFEVVASSAGGARDTAWYHVVDPSKPLDPPLAVEPGHPAPPRLGLAAAPVPFSTATTIRCALPAAGGVRLDVLDVTGRRVRRVADRFEPAGTLVVTWDGRDEAGRAVPPGVYLARLVTDGDTSAIRLVRMR